MLIIPVDLKIGGDDMCLGVPGKVISNDSNRGIIEVGKVRREVFMQLVPEAKVGDYVLVHAGCAIAIINEDEAERTLALLEELTKDEIC